MSDERPLTDEELEQFWREALFQPQTANDIKIRRLVAEVRRLRVDCYLDDEELRTLQAVIQGHERAVERFGHEQPTVPVNVGTLKRLVEEVRRSRTQS